MAFKRETDEERAARSAEKQQRADAKAREKALADDQRRLQQRRAERDSQRKAFAASPAGLARAAFGRQDRLFQFFLDVKDTKPIVIPMGAATTATTTSDPVAILNSVCDEGWELVNGSFVFHELGSESRDKFLASGQNVAVRGTIIGYYLFRRSDANKRQKQESWDVPPMERVCPQCGAQIDAEARICPECQSESPELRFDHGRWWLRVGSDWHYLDSSSGEWRKHEDDASHQLPQRADSNAGSVAGP